MSQDLIRKLCNNAWQQQDGRDEAMNESNFNQHVFGI